MDLATAASPFDAARAFADSLGGSFFTLSEQFSACRVISPEGDTYDFQERRGESIRDDLLQRDFTVDAMALPLAGGDLIDPLEGHADLAAGRLAPVSEGVFVDDPLRLLRAVRLEKELSLRLTGTAKELIHRDASLAVKPAPERLFFELVRIIGSPGTVAAVRRLDDLGLLAVLLPELEALKGITQNAFHHLDVYEHVLAAADAMDSLLTDPASVFPASAPSIGERLALPLAGDADRRQALCLASLLHDAGKPDCRFTDEEERVRFFDHDRLSAQVAVGVLGRFRASKAVTTAVEQLVRQHMRLVGLINTGADVRERARLRYIRATGPYTPESILLSVSDRLAVRGPDSTPEAIDYHLGFAREMMSLFFALSEAHPLPPLIKGDELMEELGLAAGPVIGRLLSAIEEERSLGRVGTRDEALALARKLVSER